VKKSNPNPHRQQKHHTQKKKCVGDVGGAKVFAGGADQGGRGSGGG